jgi:hypothetical protein
VLIAPDGRRAYVSTHFSLLADTFGLTVVAVEEPPQAPRSLATMELAGAGFTPGGRRPANFPIEMALAGDTLLVAHGKGLALIDVRDPAAPRLVGVLALDMAAVSVDAGGSRAVLVGSSPSPGMVVVDLEAEGGPRVNSRVALPPGSLPTGVAIAADSAVVAAGEGGLQVVSIR